MLKHVSLCIKMLEIGAYFMKGELQYVKLCTYVWRYYFENYFLFLLYSLLVYHIGNLVILLSINHITKMKPHIVQFREKLLKSYFLNFIIHILSHHLCEMGLGLCFLHYYWQQYQKKNQFLYSHYFWCDFSLMAPVYISSVILGELLNIFVSQSPHL